jgi:hypothetical protein
MEHQIALIKKSDQRVQSIILVDSLEDSYIQQWATDLLDIVVVTDSVPHVHGLWDGANFHNPENEYLVSIGLVQPVDEQVDYEREQARQELLDRLGITSEEAQLLLGN